MRLGEDLEAIANTQNRQLGIGVRGVGDLRHHRRKARDRAGTQVVAVGESTGDHHGVNILQVGVGMPQGHGLGACGAHGTGGITVIEGAREGHHADARS
ncbi:hypothetical protein D3C74_197050 [compost metagenome]